MQVLLVEDDRVLADAISRILTNNGMTVKVATNGNDGDALLRHHDVTVAVLDIGLPGADGFEIVRRMRARNSEVPVLFLTARDAIEDRVRGLELGADDYLVKPFAIPELVARIRALARRVTSKGTELSFKGLSLDLATMRARVHGEIIELSAREWAILQHLIRQSGRIASKDQILNAILPRGGELSSNAIEVYVSRIRLKIEGSGVAIRTIRGFGYILEDAP